MKILPILLVNNAVEELPIIISDCEKIILEHLVFTYSEYVEIPFCVVYFNETPLQYLPLSREKKRTVFYLDGMKNSFKEFNIHSPCNLQFKLEVSAPFQNEFKSVDYRFFLHLSLELKSSKLRRLPAVDL